MVKIVFHGLNLKCLNHGRYSYDEQNYSWEHSFVAGNNNVQIYVVDEDGIVSYLGETTINKFDTVTKNYSITLPRPPASYHIAHPVSREIITDIVPNGTVYSFSFNGPRCTVSNAMCQASVTTYGWDGGNWIRISAHADAAREEHGIRNITMNLSGSGNAGFKYTKLKFVCSISTLLDHKALRPSANWGRTTFDFTVTYAYQ